MHASVALFFIRKLEQESFTAQQEARHNAAKSRAATTSLRSVIFLKQQYVTLIQQLCLLCTAKYSSIGWHYCK